MDHSVELLPNTLAVGGHSRKALIDIKAHNCKALFNLRRSDP